MFRQLSIPQDLREVTDTPGWFLLRRSKDNSPRMLPSSTDPTTRLPLDMPMHRGCRLCHWPLHPPPLRGLSARQHQVLRLARKQTHMATRLLLGFRPARPSQPTLFMAAVPLQVQRNGKATRPPRTSRHMRITTVRCFPTPPFLQPARHPRVPDRPVADATAIQNRETESVIIESTELAVPRPNAMIGTETGTGITVANHRSNRRFPSPRKCPR